MRDIENVWWSHGTDQRILDTMQYQASLPTPHRLRLWHVERTLERVLRLFRGKRPTRRMRRPRLPAPAPAA